MKKWTFLVCMALLTASCSNLLSSKPSGTLSEKQMADLLVDIHLTEATLKIANDSSFRINDTTALRNRFALVFIKHDIDPDDFNASLGYYLEHIDELDKIYVEVINRLTTLEVTLTPIVYPANGRLNQDQPGNSNIWFRSLNKNIEPVEIQYFDTAKYPLRTNKKGPLPRLLEGKN